jgi:hypothetical protein
MTLLLEEKELTFFINAQEKEYCNKIRKTDNCVSCILEDCICPDNDVYDTIY